MIAKSSETLIKDLISGGLRSYDLVDECLRRINEREPDVGAWAFIDPRLAKEQARARDRANSSGRLHGIPVGIKDIFDTADMPTEYGSAIYGGHRPRQDAVAVARLRAAGAVVLGKTVTTEFATWTPASTRNPLALDRTPGGSSSGSAAAVADLMVPFALGTQTVASTLRPASYCGTVGFKPTYGLVPLDGAKPQSPSQDTIGFFARDLAGIALMAAELAAIDTSADVVWTGSRLPRVGLAGMPWSNRADKDAKEALNEAVARFADLGAEIEEIALPDSFGNLLEAQNTVTEYEVARSLRLEFETQSDQLSEGLRMLVERGMQMDRTIYQRAIAIRDSCLKQTAVPFRSVDALLTLAANGEAPIGLDTTGDPTFARAWSLLGLPAITVPGLTGSNGLPIGIQLVAARNADARLLGVARSLESAIAG